MFFIKISFYANKDFGGAYNTLRYAEKKSVPIINVAKDL